MNIKAYAYVQDGKRTWRVYILGKEIGRVTKGAVSAQIKLNTGKCILFPDLIALEGWVERLGSRVLELRADRRRTKDIERVRTGPCLCSEAAA